jgi:hypothetical protein
MLYTHVYTSETSSALSAAELDRMCRGFAAANREAGITGMLFVVGDHFVQVLEGERDAVWQLLHRIIRDPRNRRLRTLYHGRLMRRRFPSWNMRWMRLDDRVVLRLPALQRLRERLRVLMSEEPSRESMMRVLGELPRLLPLDYYARRRLRAAAA